MVFNNFKKILKKNNCKDDDIVLIHTDISKFEGKSWIDKCKKLNLLE